MTFFQRKVARCASDASGIDAVSIREYANANEMAPLRISFMSTAVAARYACDGGVDTRE